MAPGGVRGTASRTAQGVVARACSGSSRVNPQVCRANGAPGTIRARCASEPSGLDPDAFSVSQSAASCQYCGTASYAPRGASLPVHASEVDSVKATSTNAVTAIIGCFSGCATAVFHCDRGAEPGSGTRANR